MLDETIRIFNFDNSLLKQKRLISQYKNEVIDLIDLAAQARFWMSPKIRSLIEKRLVACPKNSLAFLGSGDFHHISEILISRFQDPLSVIIFDHHPDWTALPPRFGCGSWVNEVLKKNNILKLLLLGGSSRDISSFGIQTGNIDSLRADRVEMYPYSHSPARVFLKTVPENISVKVERGLFFNTIFWKALKDNKDLSGFFRGLVSRLPTNDVYISLDKDCLKRDYSMTNWEEGRLSLEELLLMLRIIKENANIVGMDITGDYSVPLIKGSFKKIASYLDHPKSFTAKGHSGSVITGTNEETNLKILNAIYPKGGAR